MAIGFLTHIMLSGVELTGSGGGTHSQELNLKGLTTWQSIWTEITSSVHFTMMRPILGLYIFFHYGLIRISEDNEQVGWMAIVLIEMLNIGAPRDCSVIDSINGDAFSRYSWYRYCIWYRMGRTFLPIVDFESLAVSYT